jgi:hypothetical protein
MKVDPVPDYRILIDGDDEGQDLMSLYRWLTDDPDVTSQATLRIESRVATPGEMGGAFDAIIAVLSDGIALGSLIVAYQSWRDSRPRQSSVSIEFHGAVVNLTDGTPETVKRIVEALSEQAGQGH